MGTCVIYLVWSSWVSAYAQSVWRLATDGKFLGSNLSVGKINTTYARPHVFLCLHNVTILPDRAKCSAVASYATDAFLNTPHALKLTFQ
jgi:hypothetical protein